MTSPATHALSPGGGPFDRHRPGLLPGRLFSDRPPDAGSRPPFPFELAWERGLPFARGGVRVPAGSALARSGAVCLAAGRSRWDASSGPGLCPAATLAFVTYAIYPLHADLRPASRRCPPTISGRVLLAYYAFDPPVNLFPSLHWARRPGGAVRAPAESMAGLGSGSFFCVGVGVSLTGQAALRCGCARWQCSGGPGVF